MLTGERPQGSLQPPSGKVAIDVRLDEVVLRALQDKPELRWQTAAEFGTRVRTIASNPAPRAGRVEEPLPKDRRRTLIGCLSLCGIMFSGPLLIASIYIARKADASTDSTAILVALGLPVACFLVGMLLGGIWLRRLRQSPAAPAAWSFALTVLSVVLPVALALGLAIGRRAMSANAQRGIMEQEQQRLIELSELQQQQAAAREAVALIIHSTWLWVKNESSPIGFSPLPLVGGCLIAAGLLVSIIWTGDLSESRRYGEEKRQRQMQATIEQRSGTEARRAAAEARLDGIEADAVEAQTEVERQQFERDRTAALRVIEKAKDELGRIDLQQMSLRDRQRRDARWWQLSLAPILVGLALVIPGILLISRRKPRPETSD